MEENQTNQNLNQQSVQPQPEQVQQPVQWQPVQQQPAEQPSVSMQIQQLLVQQQQYQQQYNQLVDYVKKTPNLPIEQVNQIKAQLDQLNALFVEWKQKLQALWYNQVQVNKPTEIKKWAKNNFSFKKLAIGCGVVLFLIFVWFFITLASLIRNPNALQWIWINASNAKIILQGFTWLLFWSIILLMVWVIVANIYRLITVKNQWKWKYILWLIWWLIWAAISWWLIILIFSWIAKIVVEVTIVEYDLVQPYLVWRVSEVWKDEFTHPYRNENMVWIGENYPLVAPSEMAFSLRWSELERLMNKVDTDHEIVSITLSCGDKDNTVLNLSHDVDAHNRYKFEWTCLYPEKRKYTYSVSVTYDNNYYHQRKTETFPWRTLNYESAVTIYKTSTNSSSSNSKITQLWSKNWEFILWKAPAKVTIDSIQVFRDFKTERFETEWDMNGDFSWDRVNQVNFDYSYNIPKIYYVTYKFPELSDDTLYRFPVRVEPSDIPVCIVEAENFSWTTKYHIMSDFIDPSDATKISSYNYTIRNAWTKKTYDVRKNESQEINYEFPEQWTYVVILDYVTVDGRQWWCESEPIRMKKETYDIQYALLEMNPDTWKFKEICNAKSSNYNWCTRISLDTVPHTYQLQIKSITPKSNTTKKVVTLNGQSQLNENDTYTFTIRDEWVFDLKIAVSDVGRNMEEETRNIKFTAQKADIVWLLTITSAEPDASQRKPVTEWFEPLTVVLDASKTEVNVQWDEIIYFTWDFGDWEVKQNIQNWVVAHTYNYDYARENWIFQPKVKIRTRSWIEKWINWPTLNVKKWLINVDISSVSHPSRQAPVWKEVSFSAEFDGLPERMIRDFWDGSDTVTCRWRACSEITHTFEETWLFSVKLSLEFDVVQQVDGTMDFKVY